MRLRVFTMRSPITNLCLLLLTVYSCWAHDGGGTVFPRDMQRSEEHHPHSTEGAAKHRHHHLRDQPAERTEPKAINFGIWTGSGFVPASPEPEVLIVFNSERYGNWSDWSECITRDCIEVRHRKCLDDSWKTPSPNRIHATRCLSKYYAEKRTCRNETLCSSHIGTQLIENLTETCGIRPKKQEIMMKITGGQEAKPHSWPWVVRLSVKPPGGKPITFCGGTLIAPQWILTAAHCLLVEKKRMPVGQPVKLADHMKSVIYAHLGDHHKSKKEKKQQDYRVDIAILHPKYHRSLMTDGDDIALIHLTEPVKIDKAVNYVCLPGKDLQLEPGTKCYALGWGNTKAGKPPTFDNLQSLFDSVFMSFPQLFGGGPFGRPIGFGHFRGPQWKKRRQTAVASELQEVALPIVSVDECRKHYGDVNAELHICAGSKGKDTCSGDSGGGLYCHEPESNRWTVVGVTSFGLARGCGLNPGVYTSVPAHMEWITKQLAEPTVT